MAQAGKAENLIDWELQPNGWDHLRGFVFKIVTGTQKMEVAFVCFWFWNAADGPAGLQS